MCSLIFLPVEILVVILENLNRLNDVRSFALTCRYFQSIFNSEPVHQKILKSLYVCQSLTVFIP